MEKPLIIFDTDMDTDCDDVGALSIIYEYVKHGKAELLGIICDAVCDYSAPFSEAFGKCYGIERPIGAYTGEDERLTKYRLHSQKYSKYNKELSFNLNKTNKDYEDAVKTYRKLLLDAPDNSVTVLCVGLMTAVAETLMSKPDEISPLSGKELFIKKVKKVIAMSEISKVGNNFNWDMDPLATEIFLKECPVSVYVSEMGGDIFTGKCLKNYPDGHLAKEAYRLFGVLDSGRQSWDLIATLYAINGDSDVFYKVPKGTCFYDAKTLDAGFYENGERQDYMIISDLKNSEIEEYIENQITGNL